MREATLGIGLRILIGVVGAAAVIAGAAVGVAELWRAVHVTLWPAGVGALFCIVIVCGGALLLLGAWRGRIGVRNPAGRIPRFRR